MPIYNVNWFLIIVYYSILQKAMIGMNSEAQFLCNKLLKLDNTMLMYRINNAETLEKLINTVKELHNITSSHKKHLQGNITPPYLGFCIRMP